MPSSADNASGRFEPDRRDLADLSALADGSLDPARRAVVQAKIASSPQLQALYEREQQVVERLHEARAEIRAPQALRARLQNARPSRPARARRSAAYGTGLAAALAVAALAVVLLLPGGSPGAPSVSQAAALAERGAAAPAPPPDPSRPGIKLAREMEGLYFPNWSQSFGWRATGQRVDTLDDHRAITLYYDWHGRQIAYTIVSVPSLAQPDAQVSTLNGTLLRTFPIGSRTVVTWHRAGHTCVLSGAGVPAAVLQRLAAWKAPGLEHQRG